MRTSPRHRRPRFGGGRSLLLLPLLLFLSRQCRSRSLRRRLHNLRVILARRHRVAATQSAHVLLLLNLIVIVIVIVIAIAIAFAFAADIAATFDFAF